MWCTCVVPLVLLVAGAFANLNPPSHRRIPTDAVYHRRADSGNYQLRNYEDAKALCESRGPGNRIAYLNEVKKFFNLYGLEKCGEGGCGFVYRGRVQNPGCRPNRRLTECPSDPAESEHGGYDVWCMGPYTADQPDKIFVVLPDVGCGPGKSAEQCALGPAVGRTGQNMTWCAVGTDNQECRLMAPLITWVNYLPNPVSEQACRTACDGDAACWGVNYYVKGRKCYKLPYGCTPQEMVDSLEYKHWAKLPRCDQNNIRAWSSAAAVATATRTASPSSSTRSSTPSVVCCLTTAPTPSWSRRPIPTTTGSKPRVRRKVKSKCQLSNRQSLL